MTMTLRIDGMLVDPESGEILDGIDQLDNPIESLVSRIRAAQEQEGLWKARVATLKAVVMRLMKEADMDKYRSLYGTASCRSTESIDRDGLTRLQETVEISDREMDAILLASAQTFNVARFRKAAHERGIDVLDVERIVKRTHWLDVRGTPKLAPPMDEVDW